MTVSGWKAQVKASGSSTSFTEQSCSVVAGTSNQTWQINSDARSLLDPSQTFTVEASEDGGSTYATLGVAEFTLRYLTGRVEINAYTSGSGTVANITDVRISGASLGRFAVLGGRSVTFSAPVEEHMSSVFQDEGEARIYGRKDFNADIESIERQWTPLDGAGGSETTIYDMIRDETAFVVDIQPTGDDAKFIRAWCLIMNGAEDFSGGSLNTTTITLQGSQQDAAMDSQSVRLWDYRA